MQVSARAQTGGTGGTYNKCLKRTFDPLPIFAAEETVRASNAREFQRQLPEDDVSIVYKINEPVSTDQFIALLKASTLGARRPVEDRECMEGTISNSNLTVSAWYGGELVGIARSVTDFHYACYLSYLAVSPEHQKSDIGRRLQALTQEQLGPRCKLILIAAAAANQYHKHIVFGHNPRCWVRERQSSISS